MRATLMYVWAGLLLLAGPAAMAQVAGTTKLGIEGVAIEHIALGWSAKKDVLGKGVYNEEGKKVGTINDVIIAPDNAISYVIIGASSFVGLKRHNVAIPANQLTSDEKRILLPGATKDAIKAMPDFQYAKAKKGS